MAVTFDFPDDFLDRIADEVAKRLSDTSAAPLWMDIDQAAEYTRIPKNTLYKLTSRNAIPVHRPIDGGTTMIFNRTELDEWLSRRAA